MGRGGEGGSSHPHPYRPHPTISPTSVPPPSPSPPLTHHPHPSYLPQFSQKSRVIFFISCRQASHLEREIENMMIILSAKMSRETVHMIILSVKMSRGACVSVNARLLTLGSTVANVAPACHPGGVMVECVTDIMLGYFATAGKERI